MRKLIVISGGWGLMGAGVVLVLAPIPVPLVGTLPLLTGCAILATHSKRFRRRIQGLRHRFAFLSRWLDRFVHRAPRLVRVMIHRTRPHALIRQARLRKRAA